MNVIFGQLVLGPPGSGKTTYCNTMCKFLEMFGRKVAIVNIDPANENMEYEPTIDISQLIKLEEVMTVYRLGPNGALIYCMEFLEKNINWLIQQVLNLKDHYFIFDCPGQTELYSHYKTISSIAEKLEQNLVRLCSVHLIDAHHCSDAGKYLSTLILCISTMLQLRLPQVNVMTKLDQMKKFKNRLAFNIDFYTDVLDLHYLLEKLNEDPFTSKYKKLNAASVSLIEDYSLVRFIPLDISNRDLLLQVKSEVDKANGYIFGGNESHDTQTLFTCAVGAISETKKLSAIDEYL